MNIFKIRKKEQTSVYGESTSERAARDVDVEDIDKNGWERHSFAVSLFR